MSNEAPTDALRLVPVEPTLKMIDAGAKVIREYEDLPQMTDRSSARDFIARNWVGTIWPAMLSAAPASPLPGGGPYERWSILNHLGELWTPENFDTERQATAFLDRWKRDNPKMDLSRHRVIPVLVTMTAAPTGEPK